MKRFINLFLTLLPLCALAQTDAQMQVDCGDAVQVTAVADEGFKFVRWSDGETDNPRSVLAKEDMIFTAVFEADASCFFSGTCGDNLTWELSCEGVLTISGTGDMTKWQNSNQVPWVSYAAEITSVVLPEGLTNIGLGAFYGCSNLGSIVIPNSVTSIGYQAFKDCSQLASVTMGDNVTEIGEYAFKNCVALSSIDLPDGVKGIEKQTFFGCTALSSIAIPNSATFIGEQAFSGCSDLKAVTKGHYVESIADQAFYGCTNLTSVALPENLTSIGAKAFSGCTGLKKVTMGNKVASIGDQAFYKCSNLASINLSTAISSIGAATFSDCSSLPSIELPATVTSIGESAFQRCSTLVAITIPKDVISVGKYAFHTCVSMSSATFKCVVPEFGSATFGGGNTCAIYVPCGTKDAYAAALKASNVSADRIHETVLPEYSVTSVDEAQGTVVLTQEPSSCDDLTLTFQANAAEGYRFVRWSDDETTNPRTLQLTQDTVLTAEFEIAKYLISFVNYDDSELQSGEVEYGVVPEYTGATPTKPADEQYTYAFSGWTPEVVAVTEEATYTATFESIAIPADTTFIHEGDDPNIEDIPGDEPNIVVEPGGELNVNIADIRLGVITVVTTGSASGQIHGADHLGNSWRIFMEYKLNPFGSTASPNLWYAFAVPFEVDIETGITRAYGKKSHVSGVDFQILEYDSWQRATTGKGWVKKMDGTLEPGHFYMIGIEGNCNRWLFEKKSDASISGGNNKPISSYFAGNSDNGKHNGWNGMGNSTLEYADFSFTDALIEYLHLYNNQSGVWETRLLDEIAHLVVGQPFFVQATADGSVTFAPTPSNIAARRNMRAKEERKMLRLTFEADKTDSHVDRLYLTLHDDDLCGSYTLGRDLMRMESSCKTVPQFWCLAEDGTQLNAHGISIPETETIVPLELYAPANGQYLLTVRPEQMEDFVAELLYQGTYAATLFDAQPLTLDLPSGTTSDYSLRIRRKAPQGLDDVQSDKEQCTKVLHEGHMYILQGGHIYDAQGKKIK